MKVIGYLLIALVFMVAVYGFYRRYFLTKPKPKTHKSHPPFTLKIEPEL